MAITVNMLDETSKGEWVTNCRTGKSGRIKRWGILGIYVVYECQNQDWDNYQKYPSKRTRPVDLNFWLLGEVEWEAYKTGTTKQLHERIDNLFKRVVNITPEQVEQIKSEHYDNECDQEVNRIFGNLCEGIIEHRGK